MGVRRRLGIAAVAAAAVAAAAVAGGLSRGTASASTTAFPTGPVHLTMWWWGEQEAAGAKKWLAQTVALYHKLRQHPWAPYQSWSGNTGGHHDCYKPGFLGAYVVPLLDPRTKDEGRSTKTATAP